MYTPGVVGHVIAKGLESAGNMAERVMKTLLIGLFWSR
jgi:hypothetical protein